MADRTTVQRRRFNSDGSVTYCVRHECGVCARPASHLVVDDRGTRSYPCRCRSLRVPPCSVSSPCSSADELGRAARQHSGDGEGSA